MHISIVRQQILHQRSALCKMQQPIPSQGLHTLIKFLKFYKYYKYFYLALLGILLPGKINCPKAFEAAPPRPPLYRLGLASSLMQRILDPPLLVCAYY